MGSERKANIGVIGAGPGGLAVAMMLAAQGHSITVYESQGQVGGRTRRLSQDGYSFDCGPTFFLMPYVLEEVFAKAGRRLTDYVKLVRLDPMYRLIMGQRKGGPPITVDATQDVAEMARRIAAIEPADGPAFERFISDNRTKLRLMEPILRSPMRGLADVVTAGGVGGVKFLPHLNPHRSVASLLGTYFKNPYVRLAVSFQSKYLGMSPMDCPSLFTILPFIEYEYGVWHPMGGCNALMGAMAEVCRELGVEVRLSSPVKGVRFSGKRATGVELAGGECVDHDHVVVNADATWALKNLVPASLRTDWSDARVDTKKYSCSTFMMYLGLRGSAQGGGEMDLPHHTIYISSKYRENLEDISNGKRVSDDPSVYVCNPSRIDPTLVPGGRDREGRSSLYVLMPTPNLKTGMNWANEKDAARRAVIGQLRDRFGIRDIEERIETEIICTPNDWRAEAINFGATFNMAHNLGQMLHKRVQHRMTGLDGLWFVGGGTHPGSGLPVIFLSAQIAAGLLESEIAGGQKPRPRIVQHAAI